MATYNKIVVRGNGVRKERVANAAISPGHLVQLISTNKLQVHAEAGGPVVPFVAVEDDLQGNSITDSYAAGDLVQAEVLRPGDEVQLRLANGQAVVIGDEVESAGDGTVNKWVADTEAIGVNSSGNVNTIQQNQVRFIALEAKDMSDSSGADPSDNLFLAMVV